MLDTRETIQLGELLKTLGIYLRANPAAASWPMVINGGNTVVAVNCNGGTEEVVLFGRGEHY